MSESVINDKLVTVVVPVYNRRKLIIDTLKSLRDQTYRPIEIIIVDDGSTDCSLEIAKQWQIDNESLNFIIKTFSQNNSGAPIARNRGLQEASGKFVAFLDSDDLYHPQFVEILKKGIAQYPDAGCAICEIMDFVSPPERSLNFDLSSIYWSREPMKFGKEFWATPNVIYRKTQLIDAGGWDVGLRSGWQDRELCLRLQLMNMRYIKCSTSLVFCRIHEEGKISDIARSKDVRYFIGIAAAARKLSGIAIKQGRIYEAAWLITRFGKWSVTAKYHRLLQIYKK